MTLNEKIPGLPAWPPIEQISKNEILVRSKHLPYERRDSGCCLLMLALLVVGFIVAALVGSRRLPDTVGNGVLIGFAVLLLTSGLLLRAIRHFVFCKDIRVRFTPSQIFVNKDVYQVGPPVQFRANRPSLDEGDYQKMWGKVQSGKISFKAATIMHYRRIEMVHGARLVLITSMADQERAEQFAAGLQCAYALATSQPIHPRGGNINIGEMPE